MMQTIKKKPRKSVRKHSAVHSVVSKQNHVTVTSSECKQKYEQKSAH
uniref:Uncharacterized protein n=1 Tax=Onchocerca volvulus TaxID=6282 RepID=A0A8R1XRI6_ONCVO